MEPYDVALSAGLTVLGELDKYPDMEKPRLLSLLVYSILHALESLEKEKAEHANNPVHLRIFP